MNKLFLLLGISLLVTPTVFSQEAVRPIYNVTIYKAVNNDNKKTNIFIEIDSIGNVYVKGEKTKINFDKERFASEITKYVIKENVFKYPGNNDISFTEPPTPGLNKQHVVISIMFRDDVAKEQELRNKTYYSWGKEYDKDNHFYPLFNYLSEKEINDLKALLD